MNITTPFGKVSLESSFIVVADDVKHYSHYKHYEATTKKFLFEVPGKLDPSKIEISNHATLLVVQCNVGQHARIRVQTIPFRFVNQRKAFLHRCPRYALHDFVQLTWTMPARC